MKPVSSFKTMGSIYPVTVGQTSEERILIFNIFPPASEYLFSLPSFIADSKNFKEIERYTV